MLRCCDIGTTQQLQQQRSDVVPPQRHDAVHAQLPERRYQDSYNTETQQPQMMTSAAYHQQSFQYTPDAESHWHAGSSTQRGVAYPRTQRGTQSREAA